MQRIKKIVKRGFVWLCVLAVVGMVGWHLFGVTAEDGAVEKDNAAGVLVEKQEDTASGDGVSVEQSSDGAVIPDEPAPDYAGFCDVEFVIANGERQRAVKLYLNGKEAFVFLPSYADLSDVSIRFSEEIASLSIDGKEIKSGQTLGNIHTDELYDFSVELDEARSEKGMEAQDADAEAVPTIRTYDMYQLTFMQSENLPALYIDTANGTMDYLNQDKSHWEPGEMVCLAEDGKVDSEGAIRKIHGRGNYSWSASQKGYTFSMQNRTNMIGMGAAYKWKIIANAYDPTKIRNALAFTFSKDIGLPFAVDFEFVDVYLNGNYNGNYMLCEAIEVENNRVELDDGDFLVEVTNDFTDNVTVFNWDYGLPCDVIFPEAASEDKLKEIRHMMNESFQKLNNSDDGEVYKKLQEKLDVDSFAKMFLINMVTNELDNNAASTFYYSKHGKLYSGPAWDFDHAYNNLIIWFGICPEYNTYGNGPSEWLLTNDEYAEQVREIYDENISAFENVVKNVDAFSDKIEHSLLMTKVMYPLSPTPDSDFGNYDENKSFLKEMVVRRVEIVNDAVHNLDSYCKVTINGKWYWLKRGGTLPKEFLDFLCKQQNWSGLQYANGTPFQPKRPIDYELVLTGVPIETPPVVEESKTEDTELLKEQPIAAAIPETTISGQIEEKGDIIMALLGIILLATPGAISLLVSGGLKAVNRAKIPEIVLSYLVFEFLTILISYGIITMLKGSVTISFAGISRGENYTIFHSNVVFLMATLFLVSSVALGLLKPYYDCLKDWLVKSMPLPKNFANALAKEKDTD